MALSSWFNGSPFDRLAARRLYHRSADRQSVAVFDLLREAQKILIAPSDKEGGLLLATPFVESIRSAYPQADIQILVGEERVPLAGLLPFVDEVVSSPLDKPLWSAPVKKLCAQLRNEQFDLVFCLGSDCSFRMAAIAGASGGRLRIGFARTGLDPFNYELVWSGQDRPEQQAYRHMLDAVNLTYKASWNWTLPPEELCEIKKLFPEIERGPRLALDLANGQGLRWRRKWIDQIVDYWLANGFCPVVLFSLAEDKKVRYLRKIHGDRLLFVDKREGINAAALLQSCKGLLAMNTEYLHLAIALEIPIVTTDNPEIDRWIHPVNSELQTVVPERDGTVLAKALCRPQQRI